LGREKRLVVNALTHFAVILHLLFFFQFFFGERIRCVVKQTTFSLPRKPTGDQPSFLRKNHLFYLQETPVGRGLPKAYRLQPKADS
jgi:hypothetical protein